MMVALLPIPQYPFAILRMLFAADTGEEKEKWMRLVNSSIRNANMWSVGSS